MALFSPRKEGLAATLSKPGDFLDWEHAFRIQAERLDLQQYLKRKTFLRDKPALPDIRKRKYTKTAQAQRTIRSETQESQESTQDDIRETANGTWVVSDLTEQGQKTFRQDLDFYQLEERIFKDEKKALDTLKDWVLRTVSPSFIWTCCQPHESIYEWHHYLRARCGRSEADETRDTRNRYLTLLKTVPKTTSQAIQWLDKWEEALAKGQQRKHQELNARGVFSASSAGEDPQDEEVDAHIIKGQYRSTKKGGRQTKRQRSPDGQEKCPACGLPHALKKCFYVYPNLAWKGFRPQERLQKKVKEALEKDLDLQTQVKALTRKRPKIPSQPTKEEELDQ
ncbi:hypothetical protein NW764_016328 [Fusarium oxysporum]|nr:hypothetical protein NW764_016328 [Fusarium oxysporum]